MSKFTTRVVFSHVLFEILVKTCVTHASERIAHEGLVRTCESQSCMGSLHVSHYEKYKSRLAISWTRQEMTMHRRAKNA